MLYYYSHRKCCDRDIRGWWDGYNRYFKRGAHIFRLDDDSGTAPSVQSRSILAAIVVRLMKVIIIIIYFKYYDRDRNNNIFIITVYADAVADVCR